MSLKLLGCTTQKKNIEKVQKLEKVKKYYTFITGTWEIGLAIYKGKIGTKTSRIVNAESGSLSF